MKNLPSIISDPQICHGKPVIAGTRIMVWQILELLEAGKTNEEIYAAYPTLPPRATETSLHYAAERAKTEVYVPFTKYTNQNQVFA
ncbi:DUF433 domain-containing protein [Candidatus Gottesmanbacteria bacterium]|nr:DUF433 domain-containing protein [Candidatus Gottesmanbacteria bacterium]